MAVKKRSYSAHCVVALITIALPLLVAFIKENNRPNLIGIVINDEKPKFNRSDWFNGFYQEEMDDYNNDHWAYKETMVRANNQFYYSAFNQLRVNNFVSGKEGYVFAETYIHSAYGDDLMDEKIVREKLRKAKVIQDTLKKKNIDLVLGFAPGKGQFCKDYIEDKYKHPVKTTNYEIFVNAGKQFGLNVLDLKSYFHQLEQETKYPLYPKFGHHWSYYAEVRTVDYIIKYIEKMRNTDMPDIVWDTVEVVDTARSRDADVLKSMNLLSDPKQNMQLAYPMIKFEDDSVKNRTRVLTIGDSYWYGPVYMGVTQKNFGYGEFWYYFNRVVPTRVAGEKTEVWELDLKKELESHQVIMLIYADGNLPGYGNEFIDDVYELYTSPATYYKRMERKRQIQTYAKQIRELPVLLKKSTRKSKDMGIPLDSAIKIDAMKMAGIGS